MVVVAAVVSDVARVLLVTVPLWLFLLVVGCLFVLLKSPDTFSLKVRARRTGLVLTLMLILNLYVFALPIFGGGGHVRDPGCENPTEARSIAPDLLRKLMLLNYTDFAYAVADEGLRSQMRAKLGLLNGFITKTAAMLDHHASPKWLYTQESSRRLNPAWVTLTDGARFRKLDKTPVILMWTTEQHRNRSVSMTDGERYMKEGFHCLVTSCIYTDDRSKYTQADAIVFFQMEFHPDLHQFPPRRFPHQRYVFLNRESPVQPFIRKVTGNKTFIQGFYNWTATYRLDSDIRAPYIAFYKRLVSIKVKPSSVIMRTKRPKLKMVAWFVSHCVTSSHREDYVNELKKHVQVDVFGKCGTKKCGKNQQSRECYKILDDYWFYLSFENSLCTDYVTEKVLFPMTYAHVVPLVFGLANYSKQMPPHSVIDVMHFASPRKLAAFLVALTQDTERYLAYFAWKAWYQPVYAPSPICDICERLHAKNQQGQVYTDFHSWWNKDQCDQNWVDRNRPKW